MAHSVRSLRSAAQSAECIVGGVVAYEVCIDKDGWMVWLGCRGQDWWVATVYAG